LSISKHVLGDLLACNKLLIFPRIIFGTASPKRQYQPKNVNISNRTWSVSLGSAPSSGVGFSIGDRELGFDANVDVVRVDLVLHLLNPFGVLADLNFDLINEKKLLYF
jgi:hypothetical protein